MDSSGTVTWGTLSSSSRQIGVYAGAAGVRVGTAAVQTYGV
ncbi:MAG: hypothetical protein AVDCRST_MAG18-1378 [uncultured Thermomicrobiales bacterium]|uniref:Uncharacterized protein n=1 Tax=uncultured Thermomicrobiales bacterium TaxID=1645740 RepID=A0A6J4V062_9BACT|nr:MAG: hypothetical protein AVDCRST_MAG18-1378 [uncultured Thermomicrobiales bacterium]